MAGVDSPGLQEAEEGEEACLVRGEWGRHGWLASMQLDREAWLPRGGNRDESAGDSDREEERSESSSSLHIIIIIIMTRVCGSSSKDTEQRPGWMGVGHSKLAATLSVPAYTHTTLCHTVSGEAVIIICYYYHHPSVASRECSLWQWSWSRAPAPSWYLTTQALATTWLWDPRVGLQPRQWGNVSIISHILAWMLHNSRRHSQCTLMAHTSTRPQPVTIFSSSPRLQVNLKSRPNGKWKLGWSPIVVCSQWFKPWNATFELGFIIYRHTFSATKNDIIFQLAINKPTSFCSASCNTYNNLIWICTFSVDAFIFCSRVHLQTPAASVWEHERGGQWEGETLKEAQTTGI